MLECRFYRVYKRCKFADYCLYDHIDHTDPATVELNMIRTKLDMIEKEINEKNLEIKTVLERLEQLITLSLPPPVQPSAFNSTTATPEAARATTVFVSPIPQLDGSTAMPSTSQPCPKFTNDSHPQFGTALKHLVFTCYCCPVSRVFSNEAELSFHHNDGKHLIDYEECNICYPWHEWT